jgi:PhnB protein
MVPDAARAAAFYAAAFGATELYRLVDPVTGRVAHLELNLLGGLIMLAEHGPGPAADASAPPAVRLCLFVPNADAVFHSAVEAGATILRPLADQLYGHRCGALRDPFGHEWMVSRELEKIRPSEMQRRWDAAVRASPRATP